MPALRRAPVARPGMSGAQVSLLFASELGRSLTTRCGRPDLPGRSDAFALHPDGARRAGALRERSGLHAYDPKRLISHRYRYAMTAVRVVVWVKWKLRPAPTAPPRIGITCRTFWRAILPATPAAAS